jgi:hypothetical protein
MKTIRKYGIALDFEDAQGWKWGGHAAIWAYSLQVAEHAGRSYMEHVNAGTYGEKITGYRAYEMTEMVGA